MLPAGMAVPSRSTWVSAVVPKPTPVRVTLVPPAVLPDAGPIPVSASVRLLVREKVTAAGVAPAALAATAYAPPVLFAVGVTLACPAVPAPIVAVAGLVAIPA